MVLNIKRKLMSWVEQGLITRDQHDRILAHENREGGRPWVVYGIAGIGVTTLITGIVSLIAANWDFIPIGVKLALYFIIQGGFGYLFLRNEKLNNVWREVFLLAFCLMFFGGIGLIAQIYNLRGDGWEALLMWLVINLPAVWLARNWLLCHLWVVVILITAGIWSVSRNINLPEFQRACIFASVPLLLTAYGFLGQKYEAMNERLRLATLVWGMGFILLVSTPVANVLWIESRRGWDRSHLANLMIPWAALVIAILASLYRDNVPKIQKWATSATLLAAGIYISLPLIIPPAERFQHVSVSMKLVGASGFIAVWALAATSAALAHHKRLFDIASLLIAGRFIVIYFEVFGSLAQTGVGLIISGLVILAIAYFWYRSRSNVGQWIGGGR